MKTWKERQLYMTNITSYNNKYKIRVNETMKFLNLVIENKELYIPDFYTLAIITLENIYKAALKEFDMNLLTYHTDSFYKTTSLLELADEINDICPFYNKNNKNKTIKKLRKTLFELQVIKNKSRTDYLFAYEDFVKLMSFVNKQQYVLEKNINKKTKITKVQFL